MSTIPAAETGAMRLLREEGVQAGVIVTMGGQGVVVVYYDDVPDSRGKRTQETREVKMAHVPAEKVKVVDTTAAGDTFVGAFAVAWTEGYGVVESVSRGVKASAKAVGRRGAQSSIPERAE